MEHRLHRLLEANKTEARRRAAATSRWCIKCGCGWRNLVPGGGCGRGGTAVRVPSWRVGGGRRGSGCGGVQCIAMESTAVAHEAECVGVGVLVAHEAEWE